MANFALPGVDMEGFRKASKAQEHHASFLQDLDAQVVGIQEALGWHCISMTN